jgi:hypothetical protein
MRYCKQISTGKLLESQGGGNPDNPEHLECLKRNAISSGIPANDIEVFYGDDADLTQMVIDSRSSIDQWKIDIKETDSGMPRHMEDLITNNASLVIPTEMKKRYDDKIKVRSERP